MSYYLWIGEQEQGPYSIEELQHSLNAGEIGLDQMVRQADSTDWVSVGQVVSAASVSNRSQIQPQVEPPARRSVINVPRGILLGAGGVAVVGLISMVFTTCGSGQSGEAATAPAEPSESQPVSAKLAIAAKRPRPW